MEKRSSFVGLDAHKATIQVCLLREREAPVEWQVPNEASVPVPIILAGSFPEILAGSLSP
ncbi:MAG: hypothetical protein IT452_16310 [Planctomycetia bacterium]|nr:hypothetical protein [Planctomycetia bacterium]